MCVRVTLAVTSWLLLLLVVVTLGPDPASGNLLKKLLPRMSEPSCLTEEELTQASCDCDCSMIADVSTYCLPATFKDHCDHFLVIPKPGEVTTSSSSSSCGCCAMTAGKIC